jgi:hypothetical protein
MERNYDCFEEDHMLFSERHCEPANDAGQDVQEFSSPVEFIGFVDERVKRVIDRL